MRLFLLGCMASGKSTLAPLLAARMGLPALDLDTELEKQAGLSVKEIFGKYGEPHFRQLEACTLDQLIASHSSVVLAVGGGTPCFHGGMEKMNRAGITIFLDVKPGVAAQRLAGETELRPLTSDLLPAQLETFMAGQLQQRRPVYLGARIHIDASATPEEQAEEIKRQVGNIAKTC
jgi:shikimate kinase